MRTTEQMTGTKDIDNVDLLVNDKHKTATAEYSNKTPGNAHTAAAATAEWQHFPVIASPSRTSLHWYACYAPSTLQAVATYRATIRDMFLKTPHTHTHLQVVAVVDG